ncbi:MAG: sulfatase-like hydrolase/transferase [Nitrospirae bacterium]|nr:sulfatase-like hydrolase/transferase [Nitrospirota bacterium]
MTSKRSVVVLLRVVFVLFSLYFVNDAFYKWDGYSYYMRFMDFLPELSLAFILWTVLGLVLGFILWITMLLTSRITKVIRFEHLMTWFVLVAVLVVVKTTILAKIPLRNWTGLNRLALLIIGAILTAVIIWFIRRYVEKIVAGLDSRITPIVWLFAVLFILAVPFSIFIKNSSGAESLTDKNIGITVSDKNRPNIILVTWDALTALDMQLYGYSRPTTPFLSEWAKDAVVFKRAYSSSNWTSPSLMSLMTGQRVWTHGFWYMNKSFSRRDYEQNLPKIMGEHGYFVYAFVQNSYAHPVTLGIKKAFSVKEDAHIFSVPRDWWFSKLANFFVKRPIVEEWIFETNPLSVFINSHQPDIYTTLVPSELVYNRFLEYIAQAQKKSSGLNRANEPQRPFFAWLHVFPPHDVYLPPEPYMGMFGDAKRFNTEKKQWDSQVLRGDMGEYPPERQSDLDIFRKRYDEFILYSDQQFKSFMASLTKTVDMSNTVVILTSDHGENFSKCCWQGHGGPNLFETFVHIPLIIKLPGEIKGKVIDIPVEHIDFAPTILELAGIPGPEWMEGRSFLPVLRGETMEPRTVMPMEFLKNRALGEPITKGTVAVVEGDYKLIYYIEDKKTQLFNLRSDPDEIQDLSQQKPEITEKLRRLILDNFSRANAKISQARGL